MFPRRLFVCSLILACSLAGVCLGEDLALAAPPASTKAQRQEVDAILKTVLVDDPASLDTAQNALVKRGQAVLPTIRAVLAQASAVQRDVLDGAFVRLKWNINPQELLEQWLVKETHQKASFFDQQHRPLPISDAIVTRIFPDLRFYSLFFRMYPLAYETPEPLKTQNLFVVSKTGKVTRVVDPDALKTLFVTLLPPTKQLAPRFLKDATYTWLRLSQEFSADGFFHFTIPEESLTVAKSEHGWDTNGKAVATPQGGNRGVIEVALNFDIRGRLTQAKETRNIQEGARPICQATKLLDPDPIVRVMAEQALLVMGVSAREYLTDRRAISSPAIKQAIDRIWLRIVERERAFSGKPISVLRGNVLVNKNVN